MSDPTPPAGAAEPSGWSRVGGWLREHGGQGAALVGSLLTGNLPGAVAAGVALVSSATGQALPDRALEAMQSDPATLLRLRELAAQEDAGIREHIRLMTEAELRDRQQEHEQTQTTIRAGDAAGDAFVRRTRPAQAWVSLLAGIGYAYARPDPNVEVLLILMTLPWVYAGLRQVGKWSEVRAKVAQAVGRSGAAR